MPKPAPKAPERRFEQPGFFPEEAELAHVDPAANCWRFYRLTLQPDLFGGTALVRHWGCIGTAGQRRVDLYRDRGLAQSALAALLGQKVKRGYRPRKDSL